MRGGGGGAVAAIHYSIRCLAAYAVVLCIYLFSLGYLALVLQQGNSYFSPRRTIYILLGENLHALDPFYLKACRKDGFARCFTILLAHTLSYIEYHLHLHSIDSDVRGLIKCLAVLLSIVPFRMLSVSDCQFCLSNPG